MNAGFSNLAFLKSQLLAATLGTDPRFDPVITEIGQGVAGHFERYCQRGFARTVNDQVILPADRSEFLLPRFPVESVSLIELKETEQLGFQTLDQPPWTKVNTINLKAGIIHFPEDDDAGQYYMQLRVTYTGGYFWEQLEPSDPNYPTAVPAGCYPLPPELLHAWVLQCRHVWAAFDKLGADLLKNASTQSLRFPEDYAAGVEKILANFIRFNLL